MNIWWNTEEAGQSWTWTTAVSNAWRTVRMSCLWLNGFWIDSAPESNASR
jgi:hypothetical protein